MLNALVAMDLPGAGTDQHTVAAFFGQEAIEIAGIIQRPNETAGLRSGVDRRRLRVAVLRVLKRLPSGWLVGNTEDSNKFAAPEEARC